MDVSDITAPIQRIARRLMESVLFWSIIERKLINAMKRTPKLTLGILSILFCATLVIGFVGWQKIYPQDPLDALYHTLLAFTGDDSYIENKTGPVLNVWIETARFTGLLTTISAIFGVAALFLQEQIKHTFASFRSGHVVIIGTSDFVLNKFRSEKITLFDSNDSISDPSQFPKGTCFLPGRITKTTGTLATLGNPKAVVFGTADSVLNVERAKTWLSEFKDKLDNRPKLILRIEDGTVARDLELLSEDFRSAQIVSKSETIARALLTSMAPTEIAIRRGQKRTHIALIGLGSVNLAIAEEAVLRCHNFKLKPLQLTIVDADIEAAKRKLRRERPDLLAFAENSVEVRFVRLDALECCAGSQAEDLLSLEAEYPLTAIVVATGSDTINTAMAMRLRQLQIEQLRLRAPIYMRSDSLATVSAEIPTDLTGGILSFGGSNLNDEDLELERLHEELAKAIHNRWRGSVLVEKTEANKWKNMSTIERRASYRAALSAFEIFYAAGFSPPPRQRVAGLRIEGNAANRVLGDDTLIRELSEMEHNRWMIERTLEGYRPTESQRDNEKKLHPLIRSFSILPAGEENKDELNVKRTIEHGIQSHETGPNSSCWRKLTRIGLIGPLAVDPASTQAKVAIALDKLFSDRQYLMDTDLEILTPNAPGFDREAAVALAEAWRNSTGRATRVLLMNAARARMMDKIADEAIENSSKNAAVSPIDQTEAIWNLTRNGHHVASIDWRPLGLSDTDLNADRKRYFKIVEEIQNVILERADYMIFDQQDDAKWTKKAVESWLELGKPASSVL